MTEPACDTPPRADIVKDTLEALKARARYLRNWQQLYKWSIAAGLTGVLGGLGAVVFVWLLDALDVGARDLIALLPSPWLLPLIPALGGLIVGVMRHRWMPSALSSPGATDTMIDGVHEDGGRYQTRVPFVTMVTSAITLASGGSAGREGPTVLIGAGFGSISARIIERLGLPKRFGFSFTEEDVRILAICGAAAGLGAVFRAPLGSALFAASVIYIYGMEYDHVLPALVSSLTSYLVFSLFFGFEPMFDAPFVWAFNLFDLVVVLLIGVLASLIGLVYIKVFYGVFRQSCRLRVAPWMRPALGGLLMGALALALPRVWGMGYDTIQDAIDYKLSITLLAVLVVGKIVASSLTIASGGAGGDMAPSLFIGAALGGFVGTLAMRLVPDAAAHPTLYVIAGMGALYSSVAKVPLSTAILLCESTRNFTMIVPLMIANVAAFMASGNRTIYESQHADATKEKQDVLRRVPVARIFTHDPVTAPADMPVIELLRLVGRSRHHGFPVVDAEGRLVGVVSWKDAQKVPHEERAERTVSDIMSAEAITVLPTDTSRRALNLIEAHRIGRVVVVDADEGDRVLGIVTKEDLIKAYAGWVPSD